MSLPSKIIAQKARATYKNGILEVVMPKAHQADIQGKRISIE
jgi:HSP20 family molecular chaperone IbpA